MQATHGLGPRPIRRARKGDWLLLVFAIVLWGVASGSPLMRPKKSIAVDSRFDHRVVTPADSHADAAPPSDEPRDLPAHVE